MTWPIKHQHYVPASSSFIEMMRGAMKVMEQCGRVQKGENVVIACDTNKLRIAEVLAAAAYSVGAVPTITMFTPTGEHGAQVPKPVVGACANSDVFFFPTTWSMSHSDARFEAVKNGARGCTMCEVTEDCLCVGGIEGDFEENDRLGRKIGALLSNADTVRITSADGTDMTGKITNRTVNYETGLFRDPGVFAAVPNSELNISPIEGSSEGVIIGNVRIMGYGVTKDEPVIIEVKKGQVTTIKGGSGADYLKEILKKFNDPTVYNLAEFAVGLNPFSRPYSTNLEDLGKLGFAHHGIGSNYTFGGNVRAPCHIDVIYSNITLEIDGMKVLEDGVVLI